MSSAMRPKPPVAPGLTTNAAPFIEKAREDGEVYIRQPYDLYSDDNHRTWRQLFSRMQGRWHEFANARFLEGIDSLALDPHAVPRLEDVNRFLCDLTGFRAKAVSGYVPAYVFFDCLRRREFPTTITIRDGRTPDYLPEPDIFHDIAGHVPMHTDRAFADTLVRFGDVARTAARRADAMAAGTTGPEHDRLVARRVESNIKAMARFFWFTVEFGLMRQTDGLKVYGSGLLSSYGEIEHAVRSPVVQRFPVQLEWVVNQYFEIDHYQPLLFVVDSFDHLFDLVGELETWLTDGRLDNVSPGEPAVDARDLRSFLAAGS